VLTCKHIDCASPSYYLQSMGRGRELRKLSKYNPDTLGVTVLEDPDQIWRSIEANIAIFGSEPHYSQAWKKKFHRSKWGSISM
jgi:hypothetical protein